MFQYRPSPNGTTTELVSAPRASLPTSYNRLEITQCPVFVGDMCEKSGVKNTACRGAM
jgi:hypothetical protein